MKQKYVVKNNNTRGFGRISNCRNKPIYIINTTAYYSKRKQKDFFLKLKSRILSLVERNH